MQKIRIFNKPPSLNKELELEVRHCLGVEGHEKIVVFLFTTLPLICIEVTTQILFSSNDQLLELLETDFALSFILSQFQM